MKKLFIIAVAMLFSINAYCEDVSDMFNFGVEKAADIKEAVVPGSKCKITNATPLKEIDRSIYEMGLITNALDFPTGGDLQLRPENVNLSIIINLGPTFHVYGWFGSRKTKKNEYTYQSEENAYDEQWGSSMIFTGVGLYLVPQFRFFAGVGSVTLENANGDEPKLNTAYEFGVGWSENFYGNRVEIAYKSITAGLSGNDVAAERSVASASHNSMSIGLYFPLGD